MPRKYDIIVPAVNRIIAEYAGMRLTLRQIYYRLVAATRFREAMEAESWRRGLRR